MLLPSAPLIPEDDRIWADVSRRMARRSGLISHTYIQDLGTEQDRRDAEDMLWIQRQGQFRGTYEGRYGRSKRIRALMYPLARIGMSV